MSDVNMPKLSDTMEEGTVLEWKKRDGEEVRKGDVLAEIESDKASFDIEAEADGVLHVVVASGQSVPVGQLIGRIGAEAPAATVPTRQPDVPQTPQAQARTRPESQPKAVEAPAPGPPPARVERAAFDDGSGRIKASPVARRLADEMGVDLLTVEGSGPEGRIVKEDVIAAAERGRRLAPGPAATVPR